MKQIVLTILAWWLASPWLASGQAPANNPVQLTVQVDQPGAEINPAMWGIFFEDINFGADGGLYAELVKNRGFEFPEKLMGWTQPTDGKSGKASVSSDNPFHPANPHHLRLESSAGGFRIVNEGFRGMGVRAKEDYDFSVQGRLIGGSGTLRVELIDPQGEVLSSGQLNISSADWKKYSLKIVPKATEPKARLRLQLEGSGIVALDMVSLFPRKTWKNRPGGLRQDMVQLLADLKPGFLRFPGGCIVEGSELDRRYQWKKTIGPAAERELLINRWNYEFKHRPAPDYFQSFGLGFFEFFQLCEDIGAEPLPILNCGMACQFNSGQLVPLDQLDPYIQDALDLIEFANGLADSAWGAKRAAMGHPAPFGLKMLGIGNEQWGPQYIERYSRFAQALKMRYPEIRLISSAGPAPADERFDFLWPKLRELKADIVDEHCYANPSWFFSSAARYDTYSRTGPKVFMGEYAAQSDRIASVDNTNNWECALSEAAFMTGLERNADVVQMASYAPLTAHIDAWQWTPNLIWADNLRSYGTPSYYVQQLFMHHRGDRVLPVWLEGDSPQTEATGGITLGTYHSSAEFKDLQISQGGRMVYTADFTGLDGWSKDSGNWSAADGVLKQADPGAIASITPASLVWTNYSISVKARKLAGSEGFMISFRQLGSNSRVQWNLGGWGNRQHGMQSLLGGQERIVQRVPGLIETGRWYDVRIELNGSHISGYLDGKLIQEVDIPLFRNSGLFVSAARDTRAGDVILKIVNADARARDLAIHLPGAKKMGRSLQEIILTHDSLAAANNLAQPLEVAPRRSWRKLGKTGLQQSIPANAFMVLRIPAK